MHLYLWTCYQCHLEEGWGCHNTQWYLPADYERSASLVGYLPDSAHHWRCIGSEWHWGVVCMYSGEWLGNIISASGSSWQWWANLTHAPFHNTRILYMYQLPLSTSWNPAALSQYLSRLHFQFAHSSILPLSWSDAPLDGRSTVSKLWKKLRLHSEHTIVAMASTLG